MARGISLHIGVNRLDPVKYPIGDYWGPESLVLIDGKTPVRFDGHFSVSWEGPLGQPLRGCEKDAEDLSKLAQSQGFKAKILRTKDATVAKVQKEIRSAAKRLKAGDIFLLTYAGHGSQVEDLTNDEEDNEDETWCLYDRMFLDDEQRDLYTAFAEGVRIVVLADSCHSGTATRSGGFVSANRRGVRDELKSRAMPRETAKAVYLARRKEYDEIQLNLKSPPGKLKASRILISACQDIEEAMGNEENGSFTRVLLKVWDDAKFKGNYEQFAKKIRSELEKEYEHAVKEAGGDASKVKQQVPNFVPVPGKSRSHLTKFVKESPFSISGHSK